MSPVNDVSAFDPYANCRDAVNIHEDERLEGMWEFARRAGIHPTRILETLKTNAELTLRLFPNGPLTLARPQMDHPDFLRYVATKVGAV